MLILFEEIPVTNPPFTSYTKFIIDKFSCSLSKCNKRFHSMGENLRIPIFTSSIYI